MDTYNSDAVQKSLGIHSFNLIMVIIVICLQNFPAETQVSDPIETSDT